MHDFIFVYCLDGLKNNRMIIGKFATYYVQSFDLFDSKKLLRKLFHYGFDNTYFMFITTQRVKLANEIIVSELVIKTVDTFKPFGIIN